MQCPTSVTEGRDFDRVGGGMVYTVYRLWSSKVGINRILYAFYIGGSGLLSGCVDERMKRGKGGGNGGYIPVSRV